MPNPVYTVIPLLPARPFARRWLQYLLLATGLITFGLGIGVVGYHLFAGFNWIDSFLNASMILTGMGPVGTLEKTGAKIFASFYALFSGIVFLSGASVAMAPLFHRMLHRFHLQDTKRYREHEHSELAD